MKPSSKKPALKFPKLEQILKYKNPVVVKSFSRQFGIPIKDSQIVFQDLLRFFWLGTNGHQKTRKKNSKYSNLMLVSWMVIDEMWHCFMLHSVLYEDFCRQYLGRYCHHHPSPPSKKIRSTLHQKNRHDQIMKKRAEEVYDAFGEKVFKRWFGEYPKKYTKHSLLEMQLTAYKTHTRTPSSS